MPLCYWTLCHCPDQRPCVEHTGFHCGLWNGTAVRTPADVNDALTRDAELALVRLDRDSTQLDTLEARLSAERDELEREQRELEDALQRGALGERRATINRLEVAYARLPGIRQDMRGVLADLDSLNARITSAGGLISTFLVVPYTSPTGYCACYDEKRRRLHPLVGQRAASAAMLAQPFAQRAAITGQVRSWFTQLPSQSNVMSTLGSVTFFAALFMFLLFGKVAAFFAVMVGLLLIAITLIDMIIALLRLDRQIMSIRRRIVKLDLLYYRVQSISTCQPPALPGTGTGVTPPPPIDDNAWWVELNESGNAPGTSPSPPPETP
jgi:hypothetical protein